MVERIYKGMHRSLFHGLTEVYIGQGAAQLLDANGQSLLGEPPVTVAPSVTAAPTISGATVEGSTLTGTVGTASGTPAPTAARQWLADGAAVAGATGSSFDTTGRAGQAISLRVTWSNGTGPDAVATSAAITVTAAPPQSVAPSAQTAPAISPATGPVGTVFTITEGTYAGTTPITIGGTLTQAGVDVTAQMSGDTFTSTAEGALVWSETASNGTAPDATQTASATVEAVVVDPAPIFARTASLSTDHNVHSGHSLTDTYTNEGDAWPGYINLLFQSQFGSADWTEGLTHHRDTIPGSPMRVRWEDATAADGARLGIANYQTLMITEGGPPPRMSEATTGRFDDALHYLYLFAENAYLNGNGGQGAKTVLWSIWPDAEGWIGYGGNPEAEWGPLGGFRNCLPEYGQFFRFIAEYVTWKMRQNYPALPSDWRIWVCPAHAWWMRVYDDIQAGLVPGITDHHDLFRVEQPSQIHPNLVGSYGLTVLAHTFLYQEDPRDLAYVPGNVSADLDAYYKQIAWEIATSYESAGMGGTLDAEPVYTFEEYGDPLADGGPVGPVDPATVPDLLWASSAPVEMDGTTVTTEPLASAGAAGAPLYAVVSFIPDAVQIKTIGGVFQIVSDAGEVMLSLSYHQGIDGVMFSTGLSGGNHATHSIPDADVAAGTPVTMEMWIDPTATPNGHIVGPYNDNTVALTASDGTATTLRFGNPDYGGEITAGTIHALAIYDRVPTAAQRAGLVAWAEAQYVAPAPLQRLAVWYDGDIDGDNPSISSSGSINGLNETDDESALPLMLGAQDWFDIRGITCGAQDGNVAGAQQLYGPYETDRPNLITYTQAPANFKTRAELEALTYQNANNSTNGSVNTPSRGYRLPGETMHTEAHACSQAFIAACEDFDPNATSPYDKLWLWEAGAPTLRAQINYEAVELGQMPDIWRRVHIIKPSKQNDRRDMNARRYLMGYGNDDATAGQIGYGPSGIKGPAGDMWLVQWGRQSPSRQEVVCNDNTTAGRAWYDSSIRQHGAIGARVETFAYNADSKANQTEYYRAADGVAIWWLLRTAAADSFDPTVPVIGGASRLYSGEQWIDSPADPQISVTKTGWTTGWADDADALSSSDWQALCAEIFDRFLRPRPASPAYTSLERGTVEPAPQTVRAPTGVIYAPFGFIRPSSPAAGNTIGAYKAAWARGVWDASYPLTYSFQWLIDDQPQGAATSAFADLIVPDLDDTATHTIKLRVTATNSAGSASHETALGSFVGTGTVVTPPPPAGGMYFTDFSEFTPGDLVAPWSHTPTLKNDFRFIDRGGDMVIGQTVAGSGDAAAYYTGLSADLGEYLELYSQGVTTFNGMSSLEWALGYSPENSNLAELLYRVNIDTSANNLRLRRREAYEPGSSGSRTDTLVTVPFAVDPNNLVHFVGRVQQIDAAVTNIKIKVWVDGQPEPASWMIDFNHSERPVPSPLYAGVFQNTANPSAWHTVFGVGINEPAPREPIQQQF